MVGRGFPPEAVRMSRTLAVGLSRLSRSSLGFFEIEVSSFSSSAASFNWILLTSRSSRSMFWISFFLSISFLSISAAEFVHVLLWQRCWID